MKGSLIVIVTITLGLVGILFFPPALQLASGGIVLYELLNPEWIVRKNKKNYQVIHVHKHLKD